MEYTYFQKGPLPFPSWSTVQRKMMKKGEDTVEELKALIKVCRSLTHALSLYLNLCFQGNPWTGVSIN
jgi:hypothetical protein